MHSNAIDSVCKQFTFRVCTRMEQTALVKIHRRVKKNMV